MAFDFDAWARDAAKRAGLRDVPVAAIGAVAVLALIGVVFAAWRFWPAGGAGEMGEMASDATGASAETTRSTAAPSPAAEATSAPTAVVHVVGAVRDPGVYELAEGSRVADAIESAGGMLPDAVGSAINLARPIADGEQILVPDEDAVEKGAVAPAAAAGGAGSGSAAGAGAGAGGATRKVNINAADAAALDTLPGVGPSTAAKIIAERESNGPFATVDDLGRVSGIGPKRLDALRDLISAGP